jgi:thymidylate kinase
MTPSTPSPAARFIVLEGIDGAGKSSQVEPLVAWLHGCGRVHFDVKARNALLATSLEASAEDQTVTLLE